MTDPVFETRTELKDWAKQTARQAGAFNQHRLRALAKITRVTLAHSHLIGEK